MIENSTKIKIITTYIFNVNVKTLIYLINHELNIKHKKHNKVMNEHKKKTLKNFIKFLLIHKISFTHELIFAAIQSLKRASYSTSIDLIKQ